MNSFRIQSRLCLVKVEHFYVFLRSLWLLLVFHRRKANTDVFMRSAPADDRLPSGSG